MWPVIYRIDSTDQLTYVNDGWNAFADANEGSALHDDRVIGRSLWDFLADPTTRQLYHAMVQRIRQGGLPIRFRFRCDAPDSRRLLEMEIGRENTDHVQFTVHSIAEVKRLSVLPFTRQTSASPTILTICGWCKQVALPSGGWGEIEEAIAEMQLFDAGVELLLTHGICPTCFVGVMSMLDNPQVSEAGAVTLGEIAGG